MVLSTSSPRLPPLHAHPPPPPPRLSSIPTNPTASSHYMALFRLCIVFSSSQVGSGLGDFRPLIGLDRLLKLKKLPNNHSISTPVCPCDTENLVGGTQGVWASSYQTVTDPYPVTQTVPGRRFGRYSAILVCVCVYCGQDGHGSAPLSKHAGTLSHHILVLKAVLHGCLGVNELTRTHRCTHTKGPLKHTLGSFCGSYQQKSKTQTVFDASIDN